MQLGTYPSKRHDGASFHESKRIGGRIRARWADAKRKLRARAGCVQIRFDWAFGAQAFGLSNWKGLGVTKDMCWKCMANYTNLPYWDVSMSANWR